MSSSSNPRASLRKIVHERSCVTSTNKLTHDLSIGSDDLTERFNQLFAENVFSARVMQRMVPKAVVKSFQEAQRAGRECDRSTADVIAAAMKEWAVSKGCTHYTHWFQPMRSAPAEKHDSFVDFFGEQRNMQLEFRGELLSRGEPDASSFPSGGGRTTACARGYTAWDPTSPPFIIEDHNGNTLVVPTMFLSWTGEPLDVKTPLVRSVTAISEQTVRMCKFLGLKNVTSCSCSLGPEQEFFLVDQAFATARPDLVMTGRALLGAAPAKGQEQEDHYFCAIPDRVIAYLQDVEEQLWKLGVPTKTRHAEVAPGQYEFAPIYTNVNVANDHNMLTMRLLQTQASRHGLVCLLHEKPYDGMNGSGKHNNWSVSTDTGINLLEPTTSPMTNVPFQAMLAACVRAVDEHGDLLRCSVATAGNDHRLGANEAPPAIMSIYVGEVLEELIETLCASTDASTVPHGGLTHTDRRASIIHLGEHMLPLKRDKSDRNRTSPFAFTGNKFEFRAPGSSQFVGHTTMILNVIVADAVRSITNEMYAKAEELKGTYDDLKTVHSIAARFVIADNLRKHRRVVFNGDGYAVAWQDEAAKRGLPNMKNTPDALATFDSEKNVRLFETLKVLKKDSVTARKLVYLEQYSRTLLMEAKCMVDLVSTNVLPAAYRQQKLLADAINGVRSACGADVIPKEQVASLASLSANLGKLTSLNEKLLAAVDGAHAHEEDPLKEAYYVRDEVKTTMEAVRQLADAVEMVVADEYWTLPKVAEMVWLGV